MGSGIQQLQSFATCRGRGLVLGRAQGAGEAHTRDRDVALAVASILGEDEATLGGPARTVVLRIHARDDANWAAPALHWLSERGRRVVLRTCVRMSKGLVDAAQRWGATTVLELAHARPRLQAALLGGSAEPTSALLLHAQHLRSCNIEVVASLGPLLPTVHDRSGAAASLMKHVVAADIRDAHLVVGRLGPGRLEALASMLSWGDLLALARAYDLPIDPESAWPIVGASTARLALRTHTVFLHAMHRIAEGVGLRIDHCGCPAQCHLDSGLVPACVSLRTSDLFAAEAG